MFTDFTIQVCLKRPVVPVSENDERCLVECRLERR